MPRQLVMLAGPSNPSLSRAVAASVGTNVVTPEVFAFSDENLFVRVHEDMRGKHAVLIQGVAPPVNENLVALLFLLDALRRADASTITVVMPYFGYSRGDRAERTGEALRARLCAELIEYAGAARVVTVDLNPPHVHGFFRCPIIDLRARSLLCAEIRREHPSAVVLSPDAGFAKRAREYADELGTSLVIAEKSRSGDRETAVVRNLSGSVAGRVVVVVDDVVISAGSILAAADAALANGATRVVAAVTHGIISGRAAEAINDGPIGTLYMTDTVEMADRELPNNVRLVSVVPLIGGAVVNDLAELA
jgi:ribose-phosphate pyrophosphokinase